MLGSVSFGFPHFIWFPNKMSALSPLLRDIATYFGNPVIATADGVVVQTQKDKIGGKTIKISHRGGYTTVYCHLSKFLVKPGQRVKRGDTIGLIGKTGKALGPHVHYEVRLNGKSVNPYYYIIEE